MSKKVANVPTTDRSTSDPSLSNNALAKPKKTNPRVGLSLALSMFIIATLLYFLPLYFGSLTLGVSITLVIIGLIGVGSDLDSLSSRQSTIADGFVRGKDIYNNFFFGLALIIVWASVYYWWNSIWVNIAISVVLLLGIYSVLYGFVNGVVDFVVGQESLARRKIEIEASSDKKSALLELNSDRYAVILRVIIVVIVGLVSFVSSILTILSVLAQFKIIQP